MTAPAGSDPVTRVDPLTRVDPVTRVDPLTRYATPHRHGALVVAPSFTPGRFDSHGVDSPFVFSLDGRVGMTYIGWDGEGYQTALTWRRDDGTWEPGEVVFGRVAGDPLLRHNAALTSIVRDDDLWSPGELTRIDGWFYGTFHAYPEAGYEAGPASIGFVRSRDLRDWERVGGLLRPDDGEAWERGGLYKSWLRHDGERFVVYYNAKDDEDAAAARTPAMWREQTGIATSVDLVTWLRNPANPVVANGAADAPDEIFASDPCVLRDGEGWVMFFFGLGADFHARELVALSVDGERWAKASAPLIDTGAPGSVDETHAHKPAVIALDGRLEHYYCAVAPRDPGGSDVGSAETRGITFSWGPLPGA